MGGGFFFFKNRLTPFELQKIWRFSLLFFFMFLKAIFRAKIEHTKVLSLFFIPKYNLFCNAVDLHSKGFSDSWFWIKKSQDAQIGRKN